MWCVWDVFYASAIVLDEGTLSLHIDTVLVDCSAEAFGKAKMNQKVFSNGHISLQSLGTNNVNPCLSAAMTARVEALEVPDNHKNYFCHPVPIPTTRADSLYVFYNWVKMRSVWSKHKVLSKWLNEYRLSPYSLGNGMSGKWIVHQFLSKFENGWESILSEQERDPATVGRFVRSAL